MPGQDSIRFEILEDGTIKVYTDRISAPNHKGADQLLATIATLAGGKAERQVKGKATHAHQHEAVSEGHGHRE